MSWQYCSMCEVSEIDTIPTSSFSPWRSFLVKTAIRRSRRWTTENLLTASWVISRRRFTEQWRNSCSQVTALAISFVMVSSFYLCSFCDVCFWLQPYLFVCRNDACRYHCWNGIKPACPLAVSSNVRCCWQSHPEVSIPLFARTNLPMENLLTVNPSVHNDDMSIQSLKKGHFASVPTSFNK